MKTSVEIVYLLACLLEPFMPSVSIEVLKQLSLPLQLTLSDEKGDIGKARRPWEIVPTGHRTGTGTERQGGEVFRAKYAGSQADRVERAVKKEAEANKITEQLKSTKISS